MPHGWNLWKLERIEALHAELVATPKAAQAHPLPKDFLWQPQTKNPAGAGLYLRRSQGWTPFIKVGHALYAASFTLEHSRTSLCFSIRHSSISTRLISSI